MRSSSWPGPHGATEEHVAEFKLSGGRPVRRQCGLSSFNSASKSINEAEGFHRFRNHRVAVAGLPGKISGRCETIERAGTLDFYAILELQNADIAWLVVGAVEYGVHEKFAKCDGGIIIDRRFAQRRSLYRMGGWQFFCKSIQIAEYAEEIAMKLPVVENFRTHVDTVVSDVHDKGKIKVELNILSEKQQPGVRRAVSLQVEKTQRSELNLNTSAILRDDFGIDGQRPVTRGEQVQCQVVERTARTWL